MDVPLSTKPGWKLGPHSVTAALVMKRILPICSLSLLARSLYFLALRSLCTSEAAALYSCNKAFCYLLSWTILRDQFLGTRVVAVICCMAGVVMMSYAERPEEEAQNGQILALSAAAVTASNEVLFRLLIGRLNSQESAIFLGLCSVCSSLFLWWVPLLIYLQQKVEVPELSAAPSMEYLSVTVILFFLFQFVEKIGVQFFPTSGVSLGIFLSVTVTTAMDHRWEFPSTGKLMGILAIGIGTVLVIVPENWEEYLGLEVSEQFHQEDIPLGGSVATARGSAARGSSVPGYESRIRYTSSVSAAASEVERRDRATARTALNSAVPGTGPVGESFRKHAGENLGREVGDVTNVEEIICSNNATEERSEAGVPLQRDQCGTPAGKTAAPRLGGPMEGDERDAQAN